MLPKINPTETKAWQKLAAHAAEMKNRHIREFFKNDAQRFQKFSFSFEDLFLDFSKNRVSDETMKLLFELAAECNLTQAKKVMFDGALINETEHRSVLHVALRNFSGKPVYTEGKNIMEDVRKVQEQMKTFCNKVQSGEWRGYTGKKIKYIVNIGIGGSDLGPVMVTEALKPYWKEGMQAYFVSNIDATHIAETLKKVKADETLFLIASKTFTTQETMTNAQTAKDWLLKSGASQNDVAKHFVALSTNTKEVSRFGIDAENMFQFWDWVGGRYSLWSAIGLSIALTIGYESFEELLKGAHATDNHFYNTEPEQNIPVLMALISLWYINFFDAQTEAILPYDQYLHRFAAYFQQGNMESNGKSVDRNGEAGFIYHRSNYLGRAGHKRPACILPINTPGHTYHSRRFYCHGTVAQSHWRSSQNTTVQFFCANRSFNEWKNRKGSRGRINKQRKKFRRNCTAYTL